MSRFLAFHIEINTQFKTNKAKTLYFFQLKINLNQLIIQFIQEQILYMQRVKKEKKTVFFLIIGATVHI